MKKKLFSMVILWTLLMGVATGLNANPPEIRTEIKLEAIFCPPLEILPEGNRYGGDIVSIGEAVTALQRNNIVCRAKLKRPRECSSLEIFVDGNIAGKLADTMCETLSSALGSLDRYIEVIVDENFKVLALLWKAEVPEKCSTLCEEGAYGTGGTFPRIPDQ